ncbi:flavodoxin family protein [Thermoproteota archaeon]
MVNVFVVYDTKHGNTKFVAEAIVEGLRQNEGIDTNISDIEDLDLNNIPKFDVVLIGSPNHMGGPVRGITKFIDSLEKLDLSAKQAAVFDTYMGGDINKAVSKMEKRIMEKASSLNLITSGLSIKVEGMKGPVAEGELPKSKVFGENIARQIMS